MNPCSPLSCFCDTIDSYCISSCLSAFCAVKSNLQVVPCTQAVSQVCSSFSLSAFSSSIATAGEMGQRAHILNRATWGNGAAFVSK